MKDEKFIGVFKSKIRNRVFNEYCLFFGLDYEKEKKDFIKRGYKIFGE